MKMIEQQDGLYTIEADNGKTLVNSVGIKCKRAVDQTDEETAKWNEQ